MDIYVKSRTKKWNNIYPNRWGKIEIYSLPYRFIDMWSSENAGKLFDLDSELELWTKAGHFKLKLSSKCDIREFDRILGNAILL